MSARGQRRLHHATREGGWVGEKVDSAPQKACRTMGKLKGKRLYRNLMAKSILRNEGKKLGKHCRKDADSRPEDWRIAITTTSPLVAVCGRPGVLVAQFLSDAGGYRNCVAGIEHFPYYILLHVSVRSTYHSTLLIKTSLDVRSLRSSLPLSI